MYNILFLHPLSKLNQNSSPSLISIRSEAQNQWRERKHFRLAFWAQPAEQWVAVSNITWFHRKYGIISLLCPVHIWIRNSDLVWKWSLCYLFKKLATSAYCNFSVEGKWCILCLNLLFNCSYPHMLCMDKLFLFIVSLILLQNILLLAFSKTRTP